MFKSALLATALILSNLSSAQPSSSGKGDFEACNATKNEVVDKTIWNNWFISVGAYTSLIAGENGEEEALSDRTPLDTTLRDLGNLDLGVRSMFSDLSLKEISWNGNAQNDPIMGHSNGFKQDFNQMKLHADILFNASNLICNYKERRMWNVIPDFNKKQGKHLQAVDINLDIEGTFAGAHANKASAPNRVFSAILGFSYTLPNSELGKVQFPIYNDTKWKEHCSHMIFLNE